MNKAEIKIVEEQINDCWQVASEIIEEFDMYGGGPEEEENRACEKLEKMQELFGDELHHKIFMLKASDKVKYHAAAAMVSNDMIALFQTVLNLLEQCGFAREDSVGLLRPLVMGNVSNMLDKGPVAALTGPVDRGDTETVHKHLDALADSEAGEVYRVLGKVLVKIAEQKYKGRDDTAMRQLFELSDRNPTEEQRISGKDET